MEGGIFLSIKDLQKLEGGAYRTAHLHHQALRDALKKKKYITIKEYCEFEELDFEYVWQVLRGRHSR